MFSRKVSSNNRLLAGAIALTLIAASCGGNALDETSLLPGTGSTPEALDPVPATVTPVQVVTDASTGVLEVPATSTPLPTLPPPTATPAATATPIPDRTGDIDYEIQSGDVLGTIAERFDVSLSQIRAANPGINANALSIGQTITIPPTSGSSSEGSGGSAATASPSANSTPRPTSTPLVVPPRTAGQVDTHTVRNGQYLSTIANAYGVSVSSIVSLNNLSSPDSIFVGQQLQIPPEGTTTTTVATPTVVAAATAVPTITPTPDPNVTPTATPDPATFTPTPTPDPNATPTATVAAAPTPTSTVTGAAPTPTATATVVGAAPTATATVDATAPTPTPTVDAGATVPTLTPTPVPACDPNNPFGFDCNGLPDS